MVVETKVTKRVFLLSPAHCGGQRAQMVLRGEFALARELRRSGVSIGEVFAFLSGLYFRGKLAYARAFAKPQEALVITPNRGLVPIDTVVTARDIEKFAEVDIDHADARYSEPLRRDLRALSVDIAVLLGSIATAKYVVPIREILGERLMVPAEFAGRGDMSRGGLLLRHARARKELTYESIASAARHGKRPQKLVRLNRAQITAAARAVCERIFSSGARGVLFVDWSGAELVRLGEPPADVKELIAGKKQRGAVGSFVGRNGVLIARGTPAKATR
jgi:hypothetical protein